MKLVIAAATTAAVLGLAAPVLAQESQSKDGVYANLGWSGTDTQGNMTQSITGRVGGRWHQYFGVEGEVSGGLGGDSRISGSGTPAQTNLYTKQTLAGAAYAVGFIPLGPKFDILGRVGYGASKYDVRPGVGPSYDANENGIRYGVGAQYLLNGGNGLRVDYTRQHMGNLSDSGGYLMPGSHDAGVWAVSLAHKF